jgi:hypothetical protein
MQKKQIISHKLWLKTHNLNIALYSIYAVQVYCNSRSGKFTMMPLNRIAVHNHSRLVIIVIFSFMCHIMYKRFHRTRLCLRSCPGYT